MAASLFPDIELTWGSRKKAITTPTKKPTTKKPHKKGVVSCAMAKGAKGTGKAIKKTAYIWPIKVFLGFLDILAAPFGRMAGKDMNFPILWKVGTGLILASFWLYVIVDRNIGGMLSDFGLRGQTIYFLSHTAKILFPGLVGVMGVCMVAGGTRLQQGRSFLQKYGAELEPLPAFESGIVFKLGDIKLSLRDMHTGIGAMGGIGSGKVSRHNCLVINHLQQTTQVGDVKIGDRILGPYGLRKVLKIIRHSDHPFWEIKTVSGKKTYCGPDHLWWYKIKGEDGENISETKVFQGLMASGKTILLPIPNGSEIGWEPIQETTFSGNDWGCCFVLEGTEHLYIVDGIITHNCLDPEQDLLMFDETIKKVKDVQKGDLLMGPDSKPRRIIVTSTGYGPLYRITPITGSGKPWICNDVHVMSLLETSDANIPKSKKIQFGKYTTVDIDLDKYLAWNNPKKSNLHLFQVNPKTQEVSSSGWNAEPIGDGPYCGFTLDGDGRFLLGDFTVTHNTVAMMVPLMRQFFRQLRDPDDNSEYARCGALILDEKGDFIDSTITEMLLAGRSLQDLVLIDPDLDLYRYNPLDPHQTADENAAKLAKVQKILGTSSGGDNAFWDQTSQVTIKSFLQLLEVYKPKHKIGMDDIARFMRDDAMATILCDTVEKTIEEKKAANEISDDAYGTYTDAVSSTRNAWINLNQNTKSTLKTTITNMLGPIAQNPRLQKVFCRDTNFSFRDLPNKGKIVLFRGSGIDKATARLICVCLKIDFQTWQKRRNGSSAAAYGLNTMRTVVFICDEYQEFVTCGGEGDETFYGVSRSTRTAPIVATQSYNSLETAIKNKEQTKTLRQNIATWVFFRTTDQDTCELGKFLAGQSKKEDFSTSVNMDGLMSSAVNMGSGGGKENSVSVSKKLEENFRTDAFSRLVTMTMEKSRTGPWYSEAIVYHYHDIDDEAESRCYKTRMSHLYYDNKLRKQAASNVKHLDWVLCDRNWQRKALQRGLMMIQEGTAESEELKRLDLMRRGNQATLDAEKQRATEDPAFAAQKALATNLVEKTRAEAANSSKELAGGGMAGEIEEDIQETKAEAEARLTSLESELLQAESQEDLTRIEIQIKQEKKSLARMVISESYRNMVPKKMVLRADALPGEETEEEPTEPDTGMRIVNDEDEEENNEEDYLWNMAVPDEPEVKTVTTSDSDLDAILARTPEAETGTVSNPEITTTKPETKPTTSAIPIATTIAAPAIITENTDAIDEDPQIPGGEQDGSYTDPNATTGIDDELNIIDDDPISDSLPEDDAPDDQWAQGSAAWELPEDDNDKED